MTKFETETLVELRGIKAFMENAVTMEAVKEEITDQIKHTVTECKLEQKTNTKKVSMRDAVFVIAIVGTAASNLL